MVACISLHTEPVALRYGWFFAAALLGAWQTGNRSARLAEDAHAPYPTLYRANTRTTICKTARTAGFSVEKLEMIEFEPCYEPFARGSFLFA